MKLSEIVKRGIKLDADICQEIKSDSQISYCSYQTPLLL